MLAQGSPARPLARRSARAILGRMHLVAVASPDTDLLHALRGYHDDASRFLLHPIAPGRTKTWLPALHSLDFAGALVLGHAGPGHLGSPLAGPGVHLLGSHVPGGA